MINNVVIAADFFRCQTNQSGSVWPHINMLFRLISPAISRLGVRLAAIYPSDAGGTVDVARIMGVLGLPCTPEGWAQVTSIDLDPALMTDFTSQLNESSLVVGWELPRSLVRILEQMSVPVIDLGISPLRFGRDLYFSARSNSLRISQLLDAISEDEEVFWQSSAFLRAKMAWRYANIPERRGLGLVNEPTKKYGVFVGQTKVDQSLIEGGRLRVPSEYLDQLGEVFSDVDEILVSPHPYEPSRDHIYSLMRGLKPVYFTDEPMYRLLNSDNVSIFASLSSGVLEEAPFFFKETDRLINPDRGVIFAETVEGVTNRFKNIDASLVHLDFWKSILFDCPLTDRVNGCSLSISDVFGLKWGRDNV